MRANASLVKPGNDAEIGDSNASAWVQLVNKDKSLEIDAIFETVSD